MKAELNTKKLANALSRVRLCVPQATTIPALSTILLQTSEGIVTLSGSDLERTVVVSIEAKKCSPGSLAIAPSRLQMALPSQDSVILTSKEGALQVDGGSKKGVLMTLPSDEYPALPGFKEGNTIPAADFVWLLKRGIGAVDPNDQRLPLTGLYLFHEEGRLNAVGTNGKAMHRSSFEVKEWGQDSGILPIQAAQDLLKLLDGCGEMEIAVADKMLFVKSEDFRYSTRLIDANFPAWKMFLEVPEDANHFKVALPQLISTLSELSMVDDVGASRVDWKSDGKNITLQAKNTSGDSVTMQIESDSPPIELSFNSRLFLKHLKAWDEDEVEFVVSEDKLNPFHVKGEDSVSVFTTLRTV